MVPYTKSKRILTEEDIKWCYEALANAEPYSDEEYEKVMSNFPSDPLAILNPDYKTPYPDYIYDMSRDMATKAKKMLERGWKY